MLYFFHETLGRAHPVSTHMKNPMPKDPPRSLSIVFAVVITGACFAVSCLVFSRFLKVPLSGFLLDLIINLFPFSNENTVLVREIRGVNILVYLYAIVAVSGIITFIYGKFLNTPASPAGSLSFRDTVLSAVIAAFVLTAAIQTAHHVNRFASEVKVFSGKTLPERNSLIFGLPYEFALFCKERLPGPRDGAFVTDLDIDKDPGMTLHRRLAYHLYPINIRIAPGGRADCYVIFQKHDPRAAAPKDLRQFYLFDRSNAFAVSREAE